MENKKKIRRLIRESLYEQSSIDRVLDKINQSGIGSLTSFEKEILSKSNVYSNIEDDIQAWLNKNYRNLHTIKEKRNSFGKVKDYIVFLNDDMEMELEYDVAAKKLYISYDDIRKNLGSLFDEHFLKKWFEEKYGIHILAIGDYFKSL